MREIEAIEQRIAVLDAASLDTERMFRIELKEGPRKHLQ